MNREFSREHLELSGSISGLYRHGQVFDLIESILTVCCLRQRSVLKTGHILHNRESDLSSLNYITGPERGLSSLPGDAHSE